MLLGAPSLEFMQFQNDNFFANIAACVNKIRQADEITTKVVFDSGLEDIVNKRLKTSIEFFVDPAGIDNAYAMLPQVDKNHPFFVEWSQWASNDMGRLIANLDKIVERTGYVNIENATVSGIFSKIPVKTCVTNGLLRGHYTDEEVAAIILHELGHIFTYFYYMLNTTIGGFISTAVATAAAGAKSDKEREVIFSKGARVMGIDDVAITPLLSQTPEQNVKTLQTLYINDTTDNLRSLTGYGLYELKCCEQLADAFAARFGAAVPLATGLERLTGAKGRTWSVYYLFIAMQAAAFLIGMIGSPLTATINIFAILVSDDKYGSGYDRYEHRIRYIRNHLIDQIKDAKMSDKDRKRFLDDIDDVTKIMDRAVTNPLEIGLYQILRGVTLPWSRRRNKAVELQKSIEEMFYNESYVLAAKYKGASK